MAAVKVFGPVLSTATTRVLACLLEKEVEFDLIPVDLRKGQHKKPEFLAMQISLYPETFSGTDSYEPMLYSLSGRCLPFKTGLSPSSSRGPLFVRYIAQKYEGQGTKGLLGKSLVERALIEQWMEVEGQTFNPPSSALIFQLALAPVMGIPQDQAVIAKNEEKLGKVLDVYEKRLSENKYLGGEEFSIADLSHLPNTEYIMKATGKSELISSRKYVNNWWEDISARPSWKKIVEMMESKK